MKRQVLLVILFAFGLFGGLYLPDEVLTPLHATWNGVYETLTKVGLSAGVCFGIGLWLLFTQDHLANGASRPARFFRHYWPSTFAVETSKGALDAPAANAAWFDYFNPWEDSQHARHGDYVRSFERSYGCRAIFYLQWVSTLFVLGGALATVLFTWVFPTENAGDLLAARLVVLVLAALVCAWLWSTNRVRENPAANYWERWNATGAFAKYKEIQGILQQHFKRDVLDKLK